MTRATGEWGFRVQEFEKSPGLFYVDEGTVNLYTTTWKTVIYINLREENIDWLIAGLHRPCGQTV